MTGGAEPADGGSIRTATAAIAPEVTTPLVVARPRCSWAGADSAVPDLLMVAYHDDEWGTPTHDDTELFERLSLESFQAGLSWSTILRKRAAFDRAFERFEPAAVAEFDDTKRAALLADASIVRHGGKIDAIIRNARVVLEIQREFGTFDGYLAAAVPPRGPLPRDTGPGQIPDRTPDSDALSRDLRRRGMSFVGSTIVYAFMQSVGLVDDHLPSCFRYHEPRAHGSQGRRLRPR